MPSRLAHWLFFTGSILLAAGLIALILVKVDTSSIMVLLRKTDPVLFAILIAVTATYILLGGQKWRVIDQRLTPLSKRRLPRHLYFVLTAVGVMVGQIMPAQVAVALTRALGSQLHGGRGLVRGGGATVFEQLFDLFAAALLCVPTVMALALGWTGHQWLALAGAMAIGGFFISAALVRLMVHAAAWTSSRVKQGRVARWCDGVAGSFVFRRDVTYQLFLLSLLRFGAIALTAVLTATAVGIDIPLWQMFAMMPLVILANAVAITPGALGVNEWAIATTLTVFGVPFATAAELAVVNRILMTAAFLAIGLVAAAFGISMRVIRQTEEKPHVGSAPTL